MSWRAKITSDDGFKVLHIDAIRIARGVEKHCKCEKRTFIVDTENRLINCGSCGAIVDPFEAMQDLAEDGERLEQQTHALHEQYRRVYEEYQKALKSPPRRLLFQRLERNYASHRMYPTCPNCNRAFRFEDINGGVGPMVYEREQKNRTADPK